MYFAKRSYKINTYIGKGEKSCVIPIIFSHPAFAAAFCYPIYRALWSLFFCNIILLTIYGLFWNGISGKLRLTYRTDQIYSAYHLIVRRPDLKKALANSAESHNNVFAAVNLLRGLAVNATILHVVINAGLVWHKASHQLKYDPWQQCKRIRPHDLKEKSDNLERKILRNILHVQLCGGNFSPSQQNIATILCSWFFTRQNIFAGVHFSTISLCLLKWMSGDTFGFVSKFLGDRSKFSSKKKLK